MSSRNDDYFDFKEGTSMSHEKDLYAIAGVDVEKGDRLVDWLGEAAGAKDPRVVSGVGGFAALFRPEFKSLEDPLLVTSTDGVGTKVMLASQTGRLSGLGQDLVAMCANDLYCTGATPLFFLDYFATSKLEDDQFKAVLTGIQQACKEIKAVLLGGETAEMPGLYPPKEFDLAGFIVGMVDGKKTLGAHRVQDGDQLYGWASSGFHSNGYSLLRKWIKDYHLPDQWIEYLLRPTELYHQVPELIAELGLDVLHAVAHITGGGISGNLPRVLPDGAVARVAFNKIPTDPTMHQIFKHCGVTSLQVEGVFNLGCGMISAISKDRCALFESVAKKYGLDVTHIGDVHLSAETQSSSQTAKPAEVLYV